MKILPVSLIREADAYTIAHEPISSEALMERAASRCFEWLRLHYGRNVKYKIFCGTGNNGGDGLVIARLMAGKNMHVETYIVHYSDKFSEDFVLNLERLKKIKKIFIRDVHETSDLPTIQPDEIVVDALFGSGLTRPIVDGIAAETIKHINNSRAEVVAIDIPSGLFGEDNGNYEGQIIRAKHTLSFQFPKLSFFYASNENFCGQWHIIPIDLHPEFIARAEVHNFFVELHECRQIIKKRSRFSHKGTFGHALLICGSYGKTGAAVLSAKACVRSGAGLTTVHIPKTSYQIIQSAVPEAMCSIDEDDNVFSSMIKLLPYNAVGIGPGIGTNDKTARALKLLIQQCSCPIVFDADAINILAENKTWLSFIPPKSIFTPHPKEFERLTGKSKNEYERQQMQIDFSKKYNAYVVLKGAYTCISTPAGDCYFNSTGNPGMATGGSGDVLTGIITGLLAQGYTSFEACIMGVYVHGLAGDFAAKRYGYEATTATDIINMLGKAFLKIHS